MQAVTHLVDIASSYTTNTYGTRAVVGHWCRGMPTTASLVWVVGVLDEGIEDSVADFADV